MSSSAPLLRIAQACLLLLIVSLAFAKPVMVVANLKATPTDLFFLLTGGAWALALVARQTRLRWHPAFWLLLVYLAAMLVSGLLSTQPRVSAIKLATQLYLLSLPLLVYNLVGSAAELKRALRWWLAASAVVALLCVLTLLSWSAGIAPAFVGEMLTYQGTLPPGDYPRVELSFQLPAMLCNYLAATIGILLAVRHRGWIGARGAAILFAGLCLAAFFSLTPGLGALILLIGAWIWLETRHRRPLFAAASITAGAAAALFFLVVAAITPFFHPETPILFVVPGTDIAIAPAARSFFWVDAWWNFLERPLFGSGIGTEAVMVPFRHIDGHVDTLTDAHNVFLNIAATCGIAGLAAMLAINWYVWRRTVPLRLAADGSNAIRLGLGLAFLTCFVVQGLTGSYEDARHLWVLLGLFLVAGRVERDGTESEGQGSAEGP